MSETTRMRWDPTINASAVLVAVGMAVGGLSFLYANQGDARLTQSRLEEFRASVSANAANTQARFDEGVRRIEGRLDGFSAQISNIPDLSARVALAERQLRDGETRDAAQDQRIDSLRQRVVEIGADVEGLKRASAVQLPGPRR